MFGIDPSLPPYNADKTGVSDATSAWQAALTKAAATGEYVTPCRGKYLINGTLDPVGVSIIGPEAYTRQQTDYTGRGAVLLHNSDTGPLFAPSGSGWSCKGMVFYDPRQPGGETPPVSRPPLIQGGTGGLIDITFENNAVVNCWIFLSAPQGCGVADIRIIANRIYAIQYVYYIRGPVPEYIFDSDNGYTPGIFDTFALPDRGRGGGELSKHTGASGAVYVLAITEGDYRAWEGFKSSNNYVFGYRRGIYVVSGTLNLATFVGNTWDAVGTIVEVAGDGAMAGVSIDGGIGYCYVFGDRTQAPAAFLISGSGKVELSISNFVGEVTDGSWLLDQGSGANTLQIAGGYLNNWGNASGGGGSPQCIGIANGNSRLVLQPSFCRAGVPGSVGVVIVDADLIKLSTDFTNCATPVSIGGSVPTTSVISLVNCTSSGTTGSKSVQSAAAPGIATGYANRWDKPSDV